ncbi:MAG: DUF2589 domain-containing protein [Nannocystaceae bacterium]
MPNIGEELASLDFSNLIGGPLNAVVDAQAKAAITTADFIKTVGFDQDNKVINVDFKYSKNTPNPDDPDSPIRGDFTLTVPFLTMVPIPYIRVDKAEIEFNAKITSTTYSKTASEFNVNANVSASYKTFFAKAKLSVSTAYKRSTESGNEVDRQYSMRVLIQASNADLPAGTERILSILENTIEERPSATTP